MRIKSEAFRFNKARRVVLLTACMMAFTFAFYGCDEKGDAENVENAPSENNSENINQDYQDYIHDALAAVRDSATVSTGDNTASEPSGDTDSQDGRIIFVEKSDSPEDAESVYVSSSSADDLVFPEDPAKETEGQKDADSPTDTKETTPATFDVGRGLVYIDGKYDTAYQTNLQTIINDARTGLNYPPFTINTSLGTCANLRAKEITCYLSHMRPDGSMFYSLAPDYYKGEIITIDGATEKETFDAWLEDPVSRSMIFSEDYKNIGVSTYVCNGLNCTVVSFGY